MILEVSNLTKRFKNKKGTKLVVDHINFGLDEGECLGIIGESGSGKTTTANMIAGLIKVDSGMIKFEGEDIAYAKSLVAKKARRNMQMVFQSPQASFNPRMKLLDAIAEPLKICKKHLSRKEIEEYVGEILPKVGLKQEYINKYAWQISGGECQRAAIARAIICKPTLLICDEITSALDVSIQAQIINLLHDLRNQWNMSYLFISHDLAVVANLCDKVAVMYKGQIVEYGRTMEVINNPQHPYTQNLMISSHSPGEMRLKLNTGNSFDKGCTYYSFCQNKKEECTHKALKIKCDDEHISSCIFAGNHV